MRSKPPIDVLIIGAGMAGSCLARQLKLKHPDLKITNIEKKTSFDWWVGESTVEAWEDYMVRVLKLGPFLEKNFIQKHGLRKFFDSKEKDLPLHEMTEFGRSHYHSIPARQIDRVVFDSKMCEMNRQLGIDVRLGCEVMREDDAVLIDRENGHRIKTNQGELHCRWVIDAAGRSSPLAAKLGLVAQEKRHRSFSYWGRFKNFNWLDNMGPDEWRKRVKYTVRYNSTNHFMYDGYWIWHIAVSDEVVSLGIEFNKDKNSDIKIRSGEDLEKFLRQHKCLDDLLGPNAELQDFFALPNLPRLASQHFSEDRWALAGMSGLFIDVMGSGTSRLYSEVNRLTGELIATDLKNDSATLKSQVKHFNLHVKGGFETHSRNLWRYDWMGSAAVWPQFFGANLARYFNSILPNCISDLKQLVNTANEHAHSDNCGCTFEKFSKENLENGLGTALIRIGGELMAALKKTDNYYAFNKGQYLDSGEWEDRPGIVEKIYEPRCMIAEKAQDKKIYHDYFEFCLKRMLQLQGLTFDQATFESVFNADWDSRQTLGEVAEKMKTMSRLAPRAAA